MLDQNLHKNHLYPYFRRSPSNDRRKHYDNRYNSRSTSGDNPYNKTYPQDRYSSPSRDRFSYDKVLLLHNTLDHDMILINAIHALTAHHTDLLIDRRIDTTPVLDIDQAPIQEAIILRNIQIHTHHLPDQEILDFLDPVHTPTLEITSI